LNPGFGYQLNDLSPLIFRNAIQTYIEKESIFDWLKFQKTTGLLAVVSVTIAVLLVLSPSGGNITRAATTSLTGANWPQTDGNIYGQNYNPQNAINSQNAGSLGTNWIFPIPAAPASVAAALGGGLSIGAGTQGPGPTTMVINGVVYAITNYNYVFALDATDGHLLWSSALPVAVNATTTKIWIIGSLNHIHNGMIYYTNNTLGKPLIWVGTNQYQIMALDASNGKLMVNFPSYFPGEKVPGGFGIIPKANSPGVAIDDKKGILITDANGGLTGAMRGFFKAWDISKPWTGMANGTRPPVLWQTFLMPPQDGSDPNWSLNSVNSMTYAWTFAPGPNTQWKGSCVGGCSGSNATNSQVNLKALPQSQLQTLLKGDWGDMGYNGTFGMDVTGGSWGGSWVIDTNKGMLFAGSDDMSPYYNLAHRPGPNLWAASIFGINETTGKFIWAFQQATHDVWDRDCSWGVTYAPQTMINGSLHDVILKGCKSGYVFALDANTGKMFWYFWPPNVGIYQYDQLTDIRNTTQNNLPWPNFPSNSSILFHCTAGGCLESDLAYDSAANVVYIPIEYVPVLAKPDASAFGLPKPNDSGQTSAPAGDLNSTVYAVNVATGKILWSYLIPHQSYRGGLTVSGGVVYVSTADGIQRLLNAKTGALISAMALGGPLRQEPSVGADTNGVMKVYVDDGAPGAIVALGVAAGAATSSTSGGGITTTTVTTTAPGGATTTTTVVSTTTATGAATTTGIDPTLFYGVAALAAVLAIVAGAFAVRGRRRSP